VSKKVFSLLTLVAYAISLTGCSSTGMRSSARSSRYLDLHETEVDANLRLTASKFPEVVLTTKEMGFDRGKILESSFGEFQFLPYPYYREEPRDLPLASRGKILGLDSGKLQFLPYPYWSTKVMEIPLESVSTLFVMLDKRRTGSMGFAGFALGFMVFGVLIGSEAEYDEDYQGALAGGIVMGGLSGIAGLISGSVRDRLAQATYYFPEMTGNQKVHALYKIMEPFAKGKGQR
jgi:hypothetical protein